MPIDTNPSAATPTSDEGSVIRPSRNVPMPADSSAPTCHGGPEQMSIDAGILWMLASRSYLLGNSDRVGDSHHPVRARSSPDGGDHFANRSAANPPRAPSPAP
jgi:hypothetical protein